MLRIDAPELGEILLGANLQVARQRNGFQPSFSNSMKDSPAASTENTMFALPREAGINRALQI